MIVSCFYDTRCSARPFCAPVIATWGMGLTRHKNSVATIQMLSNLMMMRGNIGRPGAGLCPVRGHSNVQGDRTMGIEERPTEAFLERMEEVFGFVRPRHHGLDVVASVEAMLAGQVKVLIALGGNFAMATPDTPRTFAALRSCALTMLAVGLLALLTHGRILGEKVPLDTAPFTLIGVSLAIFLAFRNNASYDRYWEARNHLALDATARTIECSLLELNGATLAAEVPLQRNYQMT